jgi:hypothetical protein
MDALSSAQMPDCREQIEVNLNQRPFMLHICANDPTSSNRVCVYTPARRIKGHVEDDGGGEKVKKEMARGRKKEMDAIFGAACTSFL